MFMENNGTRSGNIRMPQDAQIKITIADNKLAAFASITPANNGGMPITYNDLKEAIAEAGVVYGLREEALVKLATNPRYNRAERIAEALMPLPGEDCHFEYHFLSTKDRLPKELPDGSVDYKNLGILQNVREKDVLCTKTPARRGLVGKNVLGEEIEAPFGKDIPLPAGKNTVVSEDGLHILAAMDGNVDTVAKKVTVMNVYVIKGDVGYETGNIESVGNVHVRGNVTKGFYVHAEGNVVIEGCIEGGEVVAGGNIFVEQGIIGMNVGKIECGGDLRCKYIQNATAEVEVNFEAGYCVQSKISCGGNARLLGRASTIISSHLTVRHTIECVNVGNPSARANTTLEIGSDPYIARRSVNIPKELKEVEAQLEKLERIIQLFQGLAEQNRLPEERRPELENLLVSRAACQQKQGQLIMEQQEVAQRMLTAGYGTVNATGTVHAGTLIIMGVEKKKLESDYKYMMFTRTKEGIVTAPARSPN